MKFSSQSVDKTLSIPERFQKSICEIYMCMTALCEETGSNFDGAFWLTFHFHSKIRNNFCFTEENDTVSCDMKVSR